MDLHNKYIRTPLEYFNLSSGGGLRFSTLLELYGANASGKSTFCYQTAGYFMKDYPDGEILLLDTECSFDPIRCKHTFNWDLEPNPEYDPKIANDPVKRAKCDDPNLWKKYKRVTIIPTATVEAGFFELTKLINSTTKPTIVIWDTIAAAPTEKARSNALEAKQASDISMFGGGMMERPRVIKYSLRNIMSMIYEKPICIFLPNQVFANIAGYGKPVVSGEGSALKHDIHYSFQFSLVASNKDHDSDTGLMTKAITRISLEKSKFSPRFENVPCYIDVTKGGYIDEIQTMLLVASHLGYIYTKGSWYKIDHPEYADKSLRWKEIEENPDIYLPIVRDAMLRDILNNHFLVRMTYLENGQEELVNKLLSLGEEKTDETEAVAEEFPAVGEPVKEESDVEDEKTEDSSTEEVVS